MHVLLFAHLKELAGRDCIEVSSDAALTAEQLWSRLIERCPSLAAQRPHVRLARNWDYARPGDCFLPSDEVALIPPVSGG